MNDNEYFVLFEKGAIEKIIKHIKEAEAWSLKDFAQFSAVVGVVFACVLWILKSAWYFYYLGKFAYYGIDSCYIQADDSSIFLEIIQVIAVGITWFAINYLYYTVYVKNSKMVRRSLKLLLLWGIEMVFAFAYLLVTSGIKLGDLISGATMENIIALVGGLLLVVFAINTFALESILLRNRDKRLLNRRAKKEERKLKKQGKGIGALLARWGLRREKRRKEKESRRESLSETRETEASDEVDKKYKEKIRSFIIIAVTVAVELCLIFFSGFLLEASRSAYKVIVSEVEETSGSESDVVYVVVYETDDNYIVSRLFNESNRIDRNYLKAISKEGVGTYKVSDISSFNEEDDSRK
ncbi:MAG: hypothetical protein E7260_11185 [Lachnospiraceae bacterium]|nr:hypothetical protein [Lachnospiraceae bacterium]